MSSEFVDKVRQEVGRHRAEVEANEAPKGWEPFREWGDAVGKAITKLPTPKATHRDLLIESGFDPSEWRIDGSIQTRKWMRYDQEWLYYYKFNVVAGESPEDRELHIEDLVKQIRERNIERGLTGVVRPQYAKTFLVALSDWQVGKVVGKFGTPELINRVKTLIDEAVLDYSYHHSGSAVCLVGLGDLVERCDGHYSNQAFSTDVNQRDQNRIARELIYYAIDSFLDVAPHVSIACVGGNHGENRSNGKIISNTADNDDVAVFETVKEAYDRAGVENLTWVIPQDELLVELDINGITVAITHGHLFRSGATAQVKARNWWRDQVFGEQSTAQILLHGHFHHYSATTYGRRTAFMAPTMDGGSEWYRNSSGEDSLPGLLTLLINPESPLGWTNSNVHWAND